MRKIYSISATARKLNISRARMYQFREERRLPVDYEDEQGRLFWDASTIEKLREIFSVKTSKHDPHRLILTRRRKRKIIKQSECLESKERIDEL